MSASERRSLPLYQPQPRREPAHLRAQRLMTRLQHQKEVFITKVYLVAIIFGILTLFQWLILKTEWDIEHLLQHRLPLSHAASLLGLAILLIFLFNRGLRFRQPFNSIVALLIVELFTIGFLDIVIASEMEHFVVTIFLTMAIFIALTLLATSISRDLSKFVAALSVVSLLFFVGTGLYLLLALELALSFPMALFAGFMLVLELFYILYFAQVVFVSAGQWLRWKDNMFASLMIYFNYIVLLCTALVLEESLATIKGLKFNNM